MFSYMNISIKTMISPWSIPNKKRSLTTTRKRLRAQSIWRRLGLRGRCVEHRRRLAAPGSTEVVDVWPKKRWMHYTIYIYIFIFIYIYIHILIAMKFCYNYPMNIHWSTWIILTGVGKKAASKKTNILNQLRHLDVQVQPHWVPFITNRQRKTSTVGMWMVSPIGPPKTSHHFWVNGLV